MDGRRGAPQSAGAKLAESRRPFHGEEVLSSPQLASWLRARAEEALDDFRSLVHQGVVLDPFLEIGAGSVQRSLAVANAYSVEGAAVDVSQSSLRNAPYVMRLLGQDRAPLLICCDAHRLPFLSDTFSLVFGYQTLHHFADPAPVVAECHRVLGRGGHFFFNREPMDSPARRLLRGRRTLSRPPTRVQRLASRLGVERVFWDAGAADRELGFTEAQFDLRVWREVLSVFGEACLLVNRRLRMRVDAKRAGLRVALPGLIGGNVRGLCTKSGGKVASGAPGARLMCVDCGSSRLERSAVSRLVCQDCGRSYPQIDAVLRMLPRELEEHLFAGGSG
jgi:SAM-dependent methyltransferase